MSLSLQVRFWNVVARSCHFALRARVPMRFVAPVVLLAGSQIVKLADSAGEGIAAYGEHLLAPYRKRRVS